jgi:TolB-like protein
MMRLSPISGLILLLLAGLTGCIDSKYKEVGPPEFNVETQFKRERTISPGEIVATYTVTALTINGHPIELAQPVISSQSRFEVETKRYGTIQFRVKGSGATSFPILHLTKEQQKTFRALGQAAGRIGTQTPPAGEIRSIAVLPLENLSGGPEQEPFVDGMTETLISGLNDIGAFDKVASFTSVMTLRGSHDLSKIARDLGVDAVLEGSVRRTESRVRLAVQLIYVPTHLNVW